MSDELTQAEADALLAMGKVCNSREPYRWPGLGGKLIVDLTSIDEREAFLLDVSRASVKLERLVLQTRARITIVLARLDIEGAKHRNPDDVEIDCPHIHLYREGFHHKWAFPLPPEHFTDIQNRRALVADFMAFCKIIQPPEFDEGLL